MLNELQNTPGHDDFYTVEFSASKRQTGRWSMSGSFAYRWNMDNSASYFGNSLRALQDVATPNDLINTDNGRYNFTTWAFKVNGTYEAKYGIRVIPSFRNQSGQPYGRTISAAAATGINYGTARILVEPIDTYRQDNINIFDVRVEKAFKARRRADAVGIRRRLQPRQLERGDQHQLELGCDVLDAVHDHRSAARALRREIRLVRHREKQGRLQTPEDMRLVGARGRKW